MPSSSEEKIRVHSAELLKLNENVPVGFRRGHWNTNGYTYHEVARDRRGGRVEALVGVNKENKKVVIIFHGTTNLKDCWEGINCRPAKSSFVKGYVHKGYQQRLKELYPLLLSPILTDTANKPEEFDYIISGFSMGGSLSSLAAIAFHQGTAGNGQSVKIPADQITVLSYGAPRVFNQKAADSYNRVLGEQTASIIEKEDRVPKLFFGFFRQVGRQISTQTPKEKQHPYFGNHTVEAYQAAAEKLIKEPSLPSSCPKPPKPGKLSDEPTKITPKKPLSSLIHFRRPKFRKYKVNP